MIGGKGMIIKIILKFIIIVSLVFDLISYAQNWGWLNPRPDGNSIFSAYSLNNTFYLVGECGTVLKSTNGGINWSYINLNTIQALRCVMFSDDLNGYIGGGDVVPTSRSVLYKTTNGGVSWLQINSGTTLPIRSIFCYNQNEIYTTAGWIPIQNGLILKTTNGGANWTTLLTRSNSVLSKIKFSDENTGWVVGTYGIRNSKGLVLKTTNRGINWITLIDQGNPLGDFFVFNNQQVIACGLGGRLIKTSNGGINWITIPFINNHDLHSVFFFDNNNGLISDSKGKIYKTSNGGDNWGEIYTNGFGSVPLYTTFFNINGLGLVCGAYGSIIRSSNYGQSFINLGNTYTSSQIRGADFLDNNTGYLCGDNGTILKTTNGGLSFVNVSYGIFNYDDIDCPSENIIFACGQGGIVVRSSNGGSNWITLTTGVSEDLFDMCFLSVNTGYCSGSNGRIIKTTNGGITWLSQNTVGVSENLFSISFIDENNGLVVGQNRAEPPNNGILLKTTNGGNNWLVGDVGIRNFYNSVYMLNVDVAYAVGSGPSLIRTTNGGISWQSVTLPAINDGRYTPNLTSVKFNNNGIGVIIGGDGVVFITTNSGINWNYLSSITRNFLYTAEVRPDNTICIAGDGGSVINYSGFTVKTGNISNNIPSNFKLYNNYPNPFNPETSIEFDIPISSFVKLSIFDLTGRELEVLVNRDLPPGRYQAKWNANNYSSGLYFYRLTTDRYTSTNKMILLK